MIRNHQALAVYRRAEQFITFHWLSVTSPGVRSSPSQSTLTAAHCHFSSDSSPSGIKMLTGVSWLCTLLSAHSLLDVTRVSGPGGGHIMGHAAPGADWAQWHWVASGGCHHPRGWVRMSSWLECSWPSWWHGEGLVTGTLALAPAAVMSTAAGWWLVSRGAGSCPPIRGRPGDQRPIRDEETQCDTPGQWLGPGGSIFCSPGGDQAPAPASLTSSVVTSGGFLHSDTAPGECRIISILSLLCL